MEFKVKNAEDVPSEKEKIIKLSEANDAIEEELSTYKDVYLKGSMDLLNEEITGGGLDQYALCIEGRTPAFDKAKQTLQSANDLAEAADALEKEIETCCHKQRGAELRKLATAITEAIDKHTAQKVKYEERKKNLISQWDNVRASEANCQAAGIQYIIQQDLGYAYSEFNYLGVRSARITTPIPENSYDDDIAREEKEIEKLTTAKTEIEAEASKEEGEA